MNFKVLLFILLLFTIISCKKHGDVKVIAGSIITLNDGVSKKSTINSFDMTVINFFQQFSRKSYFVDDLLVRISGNNLLKGGLIITLYWWLWFVPALAEQKIKRRVCLLLGLLSGVIAVFIARMAVVGFPYRERPINDPSLSLKIPFNVDKEFLINHSSFPSDHAVLFFSLSMGLWMVNKRIGWGSMIYTAIFITFSRVYLCLHFATDVIVGALIGLLVGYLSCTNSYLKKLAQKICEFSEAKPHWFYAAFFVGTYELANLFANINDILSFFYHLYYKKIQF